MTRKKSNTAPSAWTRQAPQTPYPCKAPYIGEVVPGRKGGRITACATPSADKPKEGQYWIGTFESGRPMRKRHVTHRVYEHTKRPKDTTPVEHVDAVASYNQQAFSIPTPTGDERRHSYKKSKCSPGAPPWNSEEYKQAVKHAVEVGTERYAIEAEGEGASIEPSIDVPFAANPSRLDQLIYEEFSKHPKAAEWEALAQQCSKDYFQRKRAKRTAPSKAEKRVMRGLRSKAKKKAASEAKKTARALRSQKNNKLLPANQPEVHFPDVVAVVRLSQREMRRWGWGEDAIKERVRKHAGELSYRLKGPVLIVSYHQQPLEKIIAEAP